MRARGFTLVEILVVVAIGGLLLGMGMVSMNGFIANQKVASVKDEISNGLRMARNYAVTSQSPANFSSSLDYVAVTISATGLLTVAPVNVSNGIGTSYFSKQLETGGMTVSTINFGELLFSVPDGKLLEIVSGYTVKPMDAGQTVEVVVSSSSGGNSVIMSVYPSGVVEEMVNNEPTPTSLPTATPTIAGGGACSVCDMFDSPLSPGICDGPAGVCQEGYYCGARTTTCNGNTCYSPMCYWFDGGEI